MSMLGGLTGGSSETKLSPGTAPRAPGRNDPRVVKAADKWFKRSKKTNSSARALLYESGGYAGSPAPTSSKAAQLIGSSGGI